VGNPVLRGDLRARSASRKVWVIVAIYLGVLGMLILLGLPPELGRAAAAHEGSLYAAGLAVQAVLVTYFASACMAQEIAVEGEKAPVDLAFAPFSPSTIVVGKSLASLATVCYWLLLGTPLMVFAAGIRQLPLLAVILPTVVIAVTAWGIGQIGMFYSVVVESEFSRSLAHWTTLIAVFAVTAVLPFPVRWANPVVAATRAAEGALPAPVFVALVAYGALGVACALAVRARLREFKAA